MSSRITYIGHSTVLIEIDGVTILTDPLLKNQVLHLQRKKPIPTFDFEAIDVVLISHLHADHFHLPSLTSLKEGVQIICPSGSREYLTRNGFTNVHELRVSESLIISGLDIHAVPAVHSSLNLPFLPRTACLGYLLQGTSNLYFAGDTDVYPEMANLSDNLDLALLPVWGWGPRLGSGHMDPYRAALALSYLKPRFAIPIHWGTYYPIGLGWLRAHLLVEPPQLFRGFAQKISPEAIVEILAVGESFSL